MSQSISEASVPLLRENGAVLAFLRIVSSTSRQGRSPLIQLDRRSAREWGEEQIQLLEGCTYEYELLLPQPGLCLRSNDGIARSQLSTVEVERGSISPQAYTGLMPLILEDAHGTAIASGGVEVRSSKLDYRTDYRLMLDDIAAWATDLLLDLRAPTAVRLRDDRRGNPKTVAQKFAFVRHALQSSEFRGALETLSLQPNERRIQVFETKRVDQVRRGEPGVIRQLAKAQPRTPLSHTHPLRTRLGSLPRAVEVPSSRWTNDSHENRFVKFVLTSFEAVLQNMETILRRSKEQSDQRLLAEVGELRKELTGYLLRPLFLDLPNIDRMPIASSVMQRRPGYRELLAFWVKFNTAAALSWAGGEDVYGSGKRDVATLYEYWLFIKLLELVCEKFNLPRQQLSNLLDKTADGFGLKLKSGRHTPVEGSFSAHGRKFNMKFSFNRTFSRRVNKAFSSSESNYPAAGSWTKSMRPDYTLSFWPSECPTESEAEVVELMTHIHFDAKYRVQQVTELFGVDDELDADEGLDSDDEHQGVVVKSPAKQKLPSARRAKRDDLLKMHAYRDAIRRTEGAYVLYPGNTNLMWRQFHELLPGLGAFSVSPANEEGLSAVSDFIDEVVLQLASKVSQRERYAQFRYVTHTEQRISVKSPISAFQPDIGNRLRVLEPPAVLACWAQTEDDRQEVLRSKCLRIAIDSSEPVPPAVFGAQYALLYGGNFIAVPGLFRLSEAGPRLLSQTSDGEDDSPAALFAELSLVTSDAVFSDHEWVPETLVALGLTEAPTRPLTIPIDVIFGASSLYTEPMQLTWLAK
ncbi:DUF2357 domain-containing protein [Paraburkholderia nodosa]|uniref:DUF2357 domain-containing protein n=1 Tax=Paraburkholderia nodosa TaxID=392320 RepID=UPI0004B08FAD|nr:DUF2357 domain-containing protein [Paraburkholderia nodosa]